MTQDMAEGEGTELGEDVDEAGEGVGADAGVLAAMKATT